MGTRTGAAARFWSELRRRRVIKTAVAYVVGAWVIIEVSSTVFPALLLPDWTVTLVAVLTILAFPVVVVLAWIYDIRGGPTGPVLTRTSGNDSDSEPTGVTLPDADTASVAVLPFEGRSRGDDQDFLARSMADELHLTFSRVPHLRVVSRVSASACADEHLDVGEIGAKTGARFIVSGSVAAVDERLRVSVAIDDSKSASQVWTKAYDGTQEDVLRLLQEIAEDAAGAFGGVQLRHEIQEASSVPTASLDAWSRVQRARATLLDPTPAAFEDAIKLLEEAVGLDGDYAAAGAALASALGDRALSGLSEDIDADRQRAIELANQAVGTAGQDPFVLKHGGVAAAYFGDTANALRHLRRAVRLAPFDMGAWGYLGWPLAATGEDADLAELHAIMQRMLDAAPEHPGAPYWLFHRSVAYCCAGDYEAAADYAAQSIEQNPGFAMAWMTRCNALGAGGSGGQAAAEYDRALRAGTRLTPQAYARIIDMLCADAAWRDRRVAGLRAALPASFD